MPCRHYELKGEAYELKKEFDEFVLQDRIWLLPEVDKTKSVPSSSVDTLISAVKEAGLKGDPAGRDGGRGLLPAG